jgi:hypothetical protein
MWGVQLVFELHTLHVLQLAVLKVCTLRETCQRRKQHCRDPDQHQHNPTILQLPPAHKRPDRGCNKFLFFSLASNIIFKYNSKFRYL